MPSFTLYRGSLLALLFGTLLAVWLLIQPPDSSDDIRPQVVPTQQASANGTVQPGTTPQVNTSPAPGTTPQTNATAATTQAAGPTATRPAASTTPATGTTPAAGGGTYTVASGDTLGSICSARKPASMSLADCLDQVVSLNSLGSQNANLSIGQTLRIPQ